MPRSKKRLTNDSRPLWYDAGKKETHTGSRAPFNDGDNDWTLSVNGQSPSIRSETQPPAIIFQQYLVLVLLHIQPVRDHVWRACSVGASHDQSIDKLLVTGGCRCFN